METLQDAVCKGEAARPRYRSCRQGCRLVGCVHNVGESEIYQRRFKDSAPNWGPAFGRLCLRVLLVSINFLPFLAKLQK